VKVGDRIQVSVDSKHPDTAVYGVILSIKPGEGQACQVVVRTERGTRAFLSIPQRIVYDDLPPKDLPALDAWLEA
jgi:multidrug resistance efflux pump